MSSAHEAGRRVIWVPDMSRESGWSGYFIDQDERPQRRDNPVGFRPPEPREPEEERRGE